MDTGGMRRVRVAMVGCGSFACLYHVPTLLQDRRVELVAICDPSPSREIQELAGQAGARLPPSLEDLWRDVECDAVIISSPHALHAAHARVALAAGKHVLVDKPFVMRGCEAEELAETARSREVVAAVAFNRRFDRGCRRTRELLESGGLGNIRHVETLQLGYPMVGWYVDPAIAGGGPFVGRGAHMGDLIPWLFGRRPRRVRSRVFPGEPGQIDAGGFIECDFESVTCLMTVLARGLSMWDEVRIFGDDGFIELRRPLGQPLGWEMVRFDGRGNRVETVPADERRGWATTNFLDALEGKAVPGCSFAEAWTSVRVIEAAYESAQRAGSWITL
jgi:predicted dehydrogenase